MDSGPYGKVSISSHSICRDTGRLSVALLRDGKHLLLAIITVTVNPTCTIIYYCIYYNPYNIKITSTMFTMISHKHLTF